MKWKYLLRYAVLPRTLFLNHYNIILYYMHILPDNNEPFYTTVLNRVSYGSFIVSKKASIVIILLFIVYYQYALVRGCPRRIVKSDIFYCIVVCSLCVQIKYRILNKTINGVRFCSISKSVHRKRDVGRYYNDNNILL